MLRRIVLFIITLVALGACTSNNAPSVDSLTLPGGVDVAGRPQFLNSYADW